MQSSVAILAKQLARVQSIMSRFVPGETPYPWHLAPITVGMSPISVVASPISAAASPSSVGPISAGSSSEASPQHDDGAQDENEDEDEGATQQPTEDDDGTLQPTQPDEGPDTSPPTTQPGLLADQGTLNYLEAETAKDTQLEPAPAATQTEPEQQPTASPQHDADTKPEQAEPKDGDTQPEERPRLKRGRAYEELPEAEPKQKARFPL